MKALFKLIFLSNFKGIIMQFIAKVKKQEKTLIVGIHILSLKIFCKDKICKIQNNNTGKKHM